MYKYILHMSSPLTLCFKFEFLQVRVKSDPTNTQHKPKPHQKFQFEAELYFVMLQKTAYFSVSFLIMTSFGKNTVDFFQQFEDIHISFCRL